MSIENHFLDEWFSNFCMHHLEDSLKHRFLGPISRVSNSVISGVGMSLRICISYRFLGDPYAAVPGAALPEPLAYVISNMPFK